MASLHKNLEINNDEFDRFKKHLKSILEEMEKSEEIVDSLLDHIEA
jgi:hypothetical protein